MSDITYTQKCSAPFVRSLSKHPGKTSPKDTKKEHPGPQRSTSCRRVEVVLVVNGVDAQATRRKRCPEPAVVLAPVPVGVRLNPRIASVGD